MRKQLWAAAVLGLGWSVAQAGEGPTAGISGYITSEELDVGGTSLDGLGFGISGWAALTKNFFIGGEYQQATVEEGSFEVDVDQLRLGGGIWHSLDEKISIFGRAELIQIDIEGAGDGDGWGIHGGVHANVAPQLFVYGSLGLLDVEDDDGLEFLFGGEYVFSPTFGGFVEFRSFGGDLVDLSDLRAGLNWYFGG